MQLAKETELQTGDLLLFRGNAWISRILEYMGKSKYSHVGMIIKNPSFINPDLEDGLYVWDSSWGSTPDSEDNVYRYGVQMHKLDDIIELYPKNSIYVRNVRADRDEDFYKKFKAIHDIVYRKPYDLHIMDWIAALENIKTPLAINSIWKNTDHFWCSAFVAFVLTRIGFLEYTTDWSIVRPCDLSSQSSYLNWTDTVYDKDTYISASEWKEFITKRSI
jgi:hypothetical protein